MNLPLSSRAVAPLLIAAATLGLLPAVRAQSPAQESATSSDGIGRVAIRQGVGSSNYVGLVAARLEASRAAQIRVNVTLLVVDSETRGTVYQQIGRDRITTSASKVPVQPSNPLAVSKGQLLEATHAIGTTARVSACRLELDTARSILGKVQAATQSRIGMQRSLLVMDGKHAEYSDVAQRPFIVDHEPIEGGLKPVLQVLDESTTVRVGASLVQNRIDGPAQILLSGQFEFSKILDFKTEPVYGLQDAETVMQIPVYSMRRARAQLQLSPDEALLIDPYLSHTVQVEKNAVVPVLKGLSNTFKNKPKAQVTQYVMILLQPSIE